jgi:hypothetical protein
LLKKTLTKLLMENFDWTFRVLQPIVTSTSIHNRIGNN